MEQETADETLAAVRKMLDDMLCEGPEELTFNDLVPVASSTSSNKKHSKPKKRDTAFLYGNDVAEILISNQTPEQKLEKVCTKYSEQLQTHRKLMAAYKMAEAKIAKMQKENTLSQQQRSKAVLARSRLENLCRELQKLNKAQKEQFELKLRVEEEKRKEITAKWQDAFGEMKSLSSRYTENSTKMREDSTEMREKMKVVMEKINFSEHQVEKVRHETQLQIQLAAAQMTKLKMEHTAEKEALLTEKQQLLLKLTEAQVRIQELQANEVGLGNQISMYTEKYDDFQNALTKSNEVFSGFNEEMEKMSAKIIKLEKETSQWKQRWEKSHVALLEMAADKTTRDAEMAKLNQRFGLLQELCKAFQRERSELMAQLHAYQQDSSQVNKADIERVEELSKDCQQLKDNLVNLQCSLAETVRDSEKEKNAQEGTKSKKHGKKTKQEKNEKNNDNSVSKDEENVKIENDNKLTESPINNEIIGEKSDEIKANDNETMAKEKIESEGQVKNDNSQLTEDLQNEETTIVEAAQSNCSNECEADGGDSSCCAETETQGQAIVKIEVKDEEDVQVEKEDRGSEEYDAGQSSKEQQKLNKKTKDGKKKKK